MILRNGASTTSSAMQPDNGAGGGGSGGFDFNSADFGDISVIYLVISSAADPAEAVGENAL